MKRVILGFLVISLLTGCQTLGERQQAMQIAADDTRCRSYGVAPGSPAYVQCRGQLDLNRSNRGALQGFGQGTPLFVPQD